jgi:hypothetical protein
LNPLLGLVSYIFASEVKFTINNITFTGKKLFCLRQIKVDYQCVINNEVANRSELFFILDGAIKSKSDISDTAMSVLCYPVFNSFTFIYFKGKSVARVWVGICAFVIVLCVAMLMHWLSLQFPQHHTFYEISDIKRVLGY